MSRTKEAPRAQDTNRLGSGIGSIVDDPKPERQCPHCGNVAHQQSLTAAKMLAPNGIEIYRCGNHRCGCIYDAAGTRLTFAALPRRRA